MLLRLGAVSILAGSLFAAWFSFTGSFTTDDQVDTFAISVAAAGPVVVRTLSFGGGVIANCAAISVGGFDPVLGLYETTGLNKMIATGDKGVAPAGCGPRRIGPATGAC